MTRYEIALGKTPPPPKPVRWSDLTVDQINRLADILPMDEWARMRADTNIDWRPHILALEAPEIKVQYNEMLRLRRMEHEALIWEPNQQRAMERLWERTSEQHAYAQAQRDLIAGRLRP